MGRPTVLGGLARLRAGVWVLLLALGVGEAAELHQRQTPRNPSSAKECAICHYRWVDTFFVDGRGTELVPLQTEQVEGTSAMCFSCHDGSVLDSRWAFEPGRGHGAGVTPPAGMSLPKGFPLDAQGHLQCVTCHSAHGVSSESGENPSTFLRVNNTNSSLCLICHPTLAGDGAGKNHPLGPVTNNIPRELGGRHATAESAAHFISCETCHTPHANQEEFLLRQPVSDSTLCLTCHPDKDPFSADGTRNFSHAVNVVPTNAVIPATLVTNGARLGKGGRLTCLTCHKVHQNKIEKKLLVAKLDAQSGFCLNCHTNKQGLLATSHNLANKYPAATNLAGATVADAGPCSACHLPHQNARALAGHGEASAGLCLSCHGATGFAASTNLLGRSHPLGVPLRAAVRGGPIDLPLFDSRRQPAANGNITCLTCHEPHRPPVEGSPLLRTKFLRAPVAALCRECHADQAVVHNTPHDLSALTPAVPNVLGQTPDAAGVCSSCHLAHSPTPSTWAWPGPFSRNPADQCLGCHRADGVGKKKILHDYSHPVDVSLQEARLQTTLPLYLETTNGPGQITCVTCHDPHRWKPGAHAAVDLEAKAAARDRFLPFLPLALAPPPELAPPQSGAAPNFLRLAVSPKPALCANCHPAEARVLGTEHDLLLQFPHYTNVRGQQAVDSGPCGVCHLSHNAPLKAKLWARGLRQRSPNTPMVDAMCRACHAPGAVAGDKVPPFTFHPPVTVVRLAAPEGGDRTFFPLFDPVSGQQVRAGTIACSSCHNVHQWSLCNPSPRPAWNQEGDSNNSFLRHRSAELPCKVCHGLDAIYRYQYFHKSTTHQAPDALQPDEALR